ncbi:MAG: hypothetical protein OIN86_14105 [Candidatus Methanoperedens sp.]|nr:hypothetical protein [Candidatus Methanoperedens sp.]
MQLLYFHKRRRLGQDAVGQPDEGALAGAVFMLRIFQSKPLQ